MLEAEEFWCRKFGELPEKQLRNIQRIWELNEIKQKIDFLSGSLQDKSDKARFNGNSARESGVWLNALPSPQLGTF